MCGKAGKLACLLLAVSAFGTQPLAAQNGAYYQSSDGTLAVGNPRIELVFKTANGSLLDLIDKTTGVDLISQKVGNYNGFFFRYTTPANSTPQQSGGYLASQVSLSPVATSTGVQLTIQFSQFMASSAVLHVSATLVVTVDNSSPLTTWQLSITNNDQITIEDVALPSIAGVGQLSVDPSNDYLAVPAVSGILFQDPVHNFVLNAGWNGMYPGGYGNMQFLAYYSKESGAGLYLASQDNAGYTKTLNVGSLSPEWMTVEHHYIPPFQPAASVTIPYTVTLGIFHGDWFDAAMLYRGWALEQPWAQNGPLISNTDIPDWFKKLGLMSWKDTLTGLGPSNSYATLAQAAAAWQQEVQSPLNQDWIGWEQYGPWNNIPDFLPPSQGWPAFDSAVSATHAAGGKLSAVPSTNYATLGAPSWGSLQAAASLQADGSMYTNQTSVPAQNGQFQNQTTAQMDPTMLWHDAVLNVLTQLQQNGIDMIQMDGNPFQQGVCYATSHSHVPGGGNWWFQDYSHIYSDVRTAGRSVNPDFVMGGEFYAEPFLNLADSGWDATTAGLDPSMIEGASVTDHTKVSFIPLWQAVYHDYTLTYSMLAFINGQDMPYYRRALGIPAVWGEISMIEGDDGFPYSLSGFNASLVEYVKRLVSLRTTYGYPFVVLGRMLRPPQPEVPRYTIPPATGIPYTGANTSAFSAPSVLSGAWQSPEGDAALIFTNISNSPVSFSWTVSASDVPLNSGDPYTLYLLHNGKCSIARPDVSLPYTLNFNALSTDIDVAIFSQSTMECGPEGLRRR